MILAAALIAAPLAVRADDAPTPEARGKRLFLQCAACHSIEAGAANKIGPNLHGVVGRPAASAPDYVYSDALKGSGLVWDQATLDRWLLRPSALVPGTKMAFIGVAKPEDRAAILAYLASEGAAR